jgi:hypothetical protein
MRARGRTRNKRIRRGKIEGAPSEAEIGKGEGKASDEG